MKIAVSGTSGIGKSTFVSDFIDAWPQYKQPLKSYRDIAKEQNLTLNEDGTEESQKIIRDILTDEVIANKDDFVIYDRCILDNLIYTLWLSSRGKVSDKFVKESIDVTRETLAFFDLIFFLPITKHSPVKLVESDQRSNDPMFRDEVDILFKSLMSAYLKQSNVYFPFKSQLGCPAIIEIFGDRKQRVELSKLYITKEGKVYGEDESLLVPETEMDEDGKALAREVFKI
jgi:hypothetical protein